MSVDEGEAELEVTEWVLVDVAEELSALLDGATLGLEEAILGLIAVVLIIV